MGAIVAVDFTAGTPAQAALPEADSEQQSGGTFCRVRHPSLSHVSCARLNGHDGEHCAFVFSISQPERWS